MRKNNKIIYQLSLRTFTPEGTLNAAALLLGHIAGLGVDIVYLCPFYVEDDDVNRETWSERQIKSNVNNPKNPYKIVDYFNVDEEYGTNEDLKEFVREVHKNGLLVMFDLVYLHCGKNAVFIQEHPGFVQRNDDGTIRVPALWPFVRLNFENRALRSYLLNHMETMIVEYGADGFRCDVGDEVPLDFWKEAFEYLKGIKPELIMLNEGVNPKYLNEAFDMCYDFEWNELLVDIFANNMPASKLESLYKRKQAEYGENIDKLVRTIDTHDTASDRGLDRNEIVMTPRGVEAALVITNTFDGVAFLWNGYEVCDNAENSMFSNRFYGRRNYINWSRAFTKDGLRRIEFIKKIHRLHHEADAIVNGKIGWVLNSTPDEVVSYVKESDKQKLLIVVNTKNKAVETEVFEPYNAAQILMSYGIDMENRRVRLAPYGYMIAASGARSL